MVIRHLQDEITRFQITGLIPVLGIQHRTLVDDLQVVGSQILYRIKVGYFVDHILVANHPNLGKRRTKGSG